MRNQRYEDLLKWPHLNALRESAKKRANAEGQAQVLRLDLEAASREAAEVKSVLAKSDRNSKDLENQLNKAQQRSLDLQNQLADTGANLEGLRIKNGQLKEALAKAQNEVCSLAQFLRLFKHLFKIDGVLGQTEPCIFSPLPGVIVIGHEWDPPVFRKNPLI